MFQLFQSYVALSVFMLQIASVLSRYCICFTHTLQVYVPNVLSASDVCCIQVFSCCKCFIFQRYVQRVMGMHGLGVGARCAASRGPTDGVSDASEVLRTGHARPQGSGRRSGGHGAGRARIGARYACRAGEVNGAGHMRAAASSAVAGAGGRAGDRSQGYTMTFSDGLFC
jgi:hypothetical protein